VVLVLCLQDEEEEPLNRREQARRDRQDARAAAEAARQAKETKISAYRDKQEKKEREREERERAQVSDCCLESVIDDVLCNLCCALQCACRRAGAALCWCGGTVVADDLWGLVPVLYTCAICAG
jgi:hypothetical protein